MGRLLSELRERELDGSGGHFRWRERVIEPGPEVPIREQVEAQQGDQIRERPAELGLELEIAEDEHRDQGRPDLDAESVGGGSDEGLDPQVLLEGLEEQLDLPALLVDRCDRARREVQMVGEKHHGLFTIGDSGDDSAKQHRRVELDPVRAKVEVQLDHFVAKNGAPAGHLAPLDHAVVRAILHACDEPDALQGQRHEPQKIVVAAIENDDGTGRKVDSPRRANVRCLRLRDQGVARKQPLIVEQHVDFDPALRRAELRPVEDARAEIDHGRIEREQRILQFQPALRRDRAAPLEQNLEQRLEQLPRPMGIRVGQRRAGWCGVDSEVVELPFRRLQAATDLTKRLGLAEMAEQRRHGLVPAGKPAGMPFGLVLSGELLELRSGKDLENLLEDAAYSVHRWGPSCTLSFAQLQLYRPRRFSSRRPRRSQEANLDGSDGIRAPRGGIPNRIRWQSTRSRRSVNECALRVQCMSTHSTIRSDTSIRWVCSRAPATTAALTVPAVIGLAWAPTRARGFSSG